MFKDIDEYQNAKNKLREAAKNYVAVLNAIDTLGASELADAEDALDKAAFIRCGFEID